jgi:glycyl-tRNA synthetase (class II)
MMFETSVGPIKSEDSMAYLRPETAQGMFVNFKNVVDSFYPDIPFGIAQIGKAFRNEISPREFIFRVREFEIAELEYFIEEKNWETEFENWMMRFYDWCQSIGLEKSKIHELEVSEADRAHYSKRTVDFEYEFEFGVKEIGAVAYRTDLILKIMPKKVAPSLSTDQKVVGKLIHRTLSSQPSVSIVSCLRFSRQPTRKKTVEHGSHSQNQSLQLKWRSRHWRATNQS